MPPESVPPRKDSPSASRPIPSRSRGTDAEVLNLRELLAVVRRNWWVVLASAGLIAGLAAYFAFTAPASFRAKGVIKLANSRRAMAGSLSADNADAAVGLYYASPNSVQKPFVHTR